MIYKDLTQVKVEEVVVGPGLMVIKDGLDNVI